MITIQFEMSEELEALVDSELQEVLKNMSIATVQARYTRIQQENLKKVSTGEMALITKAEYDDYQQLKAQSDPQSL